jgi:hypothetical protein
MKMKQISKLKHTKIQKGGLNNKKTTITNRIKAILNNNSLHNYNYENMTKTYRRNFNKNKFLTHNDNLTAEQRLQIESNYQKQKKNQNQNQKQYHQQKTYKSNTQVRLTPNPLYESGQSVPLVKNPLYESSPNPLRRLPT